MKEFIKKMPLFTEMQDEDLTSLCKMIEQIHLPAGAELFSEGDLGDQAYIIKEGEIEIYKQSGGRSILLAIRGEGEIIGEMSLLEAQPRNASGRARTDSVLLALSHQQLNDLINTSPSAARSMLETFTARLKSMDLTLQQSEKMAQLGTLTAGIAHELNNPAAAVLRGSDQLSHAVGQLQDVLMMLNSLQLDDQQRDRLEGVRQMIEGAGSRPYNGDPLARSEAEEKLELWLEEQNIEDAWELAPVLAGLGIPAEQLTAPLEPFIDLTAPDGSRILPAVVRWVCASLMVETLLMEINQGAARIAETVQAVKSYAYLDQAEVQLIDIHEGLENTLVILRSALKDGISVRREYAGDLPRIEAYGSELNQVWTNLISNAIDALEGQGEIILRTHFTHPWVVVEVEDNGPGIPEEIQSRLFSPFFTTKPVGKGSGLGLHITYNIVQKHRGDIRLISKPGKTRFLVALPVEIKAPGSDMPVSPDIEALIDDREIE
jgi:signal transduction histidine kinase